MKKVLIVITLLLLVTVSVTGCDNKGLTVEQRQTYINMAIDYENKAAEAQEWADASWKATLQLTGAYDAARRAAMESFAKEKQNLASDYRQQALRYRELAAK